MSIDYHIVISFELSISNSNSKEKSVKLIKNEIAKYKSLMDKPPIKTHHRFYSMFLNQLL